jgi:lipopolysaccharide transport system ATP-binding protein
LGIRLRYCNPGSIRQTHVNITFFDDQGVGLMNASTGLTQSPIVLSESGVITCWIPRMPLIPGHYRLSVALHDHGEIYDLVSNAIILDVPSSVYYPAGAVPERRHANLMIDHSWEHRTASRDSTS